MNQLTFLTIAMNTTSNRIWAMLFWLSFVGAAHGSTLALWDFDDPALGATNGAALPDSDSYTIWREAATDKSGNGNHLTTWQYDWAGFTWSDYSPQGDLSIKAAGGYPAAYTWSAANPPTGVDLETAALTNFTIEGVFTVTGGGNRTLVGRDGRYLSVAAPDNAALYLQIDGEDHPVIEFTDVNSNRVRLVASATVIDDDATWYHLAGVSDGSTVSLYLDHSLIASTNIAMGAVAIGSTSGSDWHAGGWSVARGLFAGNHSDRWFGYIDAVAISDSVLDAATFVLETPDNSTLIPNLANVTNEVVYLFCYHVGGWPSGGSSGVFVNWSIDGFKFHPLNNGHPVFVTPQLPGDDDDDPDNDPNLTRDPSIIYGTDGLYHMVWTSELWTRSFGYAESPDLKHWTNIKLVEMWPNPADTIGQTWAPEWFYLEETGEYMILFSSAVNSTSLRLYYTKTTDFETFTPPTELYHDVAQSSVIDGFISKVGTDQYMMATAQKGTIWIVDSTSPYGPWTERASAAMVSPREGPALIKINGLWHLYADYYTGVSDDVFRMSTSTDAINWADRSAETDLPANSDVPDFDGPPHHGTVFEAPRSTLGAFLDGPQGALTNLDSLVYRWSFDNPAGPVIAGTTVTDTVSSATAIVRGIGAEFTGSGLRLPGNTTGNTEANSMAAYLDLPNGLISALTNLTVEIWVTPISSKSWQRLFSFGRTVEEGDGNGEWFGTPGSAAPGLTSASNTLFLSLNRGDNLSQQRCTMLVGDAIAETIDTAMDTSVGNQSHYAVTFEAGVGYHGASGGRITLYRDGLWVSYRDVPFRLSDVDDVNNWLGRSQWSSDFNANVEIDEVRIYSEALTPAEIARAEAAGPDQLPSLVLPVPNIVERIYAITMENKLISLNSTDPGTILSAQTVSGLQVNETIVGLDFWNGTLYGLGSLNHLYTLNVANGAAGLVGAFIPVMNGLAFGFDAEPGGLRLVSNLDQNLLLDYGTGAATVGTTVNGSINPAITGLAYHPGNGIRYVADYSQNTIGSLDADSGLVSTIGSSGIDFSRHNGFDISSNPGNTAYLASPAASSGLAANLYTVDLTTGSATLVGLIGLVGDNTLIRGLSVGPGYVDLTPINFTMSAAGSQLTFSWPSDHIGWRLEAQTNSLEIGLSSNWVTVPNSTETNSMTIPTSSDSVGSVFFRLVYP